MSVYSQIYETVYISCSELPAFASPWDIFQAAPDCRGPILEPDETLATLRSRFTRTELVRAGVVTDDRLNPALINPMGAVIAMRLEARRAPFALVTGRGCLRSRQNPVLVALDDVWTMAQIYKYGFVVATPYIADVVLFRALGIAATLTVGMHDLPLQRIKDLDRQFAPRRDYDIPPVQVPQPVATPADGVAYDRHELIIANWRLKDLSLEQPPTLAPLVAQLRDVRSRLGYSFDGIESWRPSAETTEDLNFALRHRRPCLVRSLLHESVDVETTSWWGIHAARRFGDQATGHQPGAGLPAAGIGGSAGISVADAHRDILRRGLL